jgi:hypothetical protein
MRLPVSLTAEYRGVDGLAGETEIEGAHITYGDRHRFEFQQPDGTIDTLSLRVGKLDQAANFDVSKLKPGEFVKIDGIAGDGQRGMYFQPVTVVKTDARQLAAA